MGVSEEVNTDEDGKTKCWDQEISRKHWRHKTNKEVARSDLNLRKIYLSDFYGWEAGIPSCNCPGESVVTKTVSRQKN